MASCSAATMPDPDFFSELDLDDEEDAELDELEKELELEDDDDLEGSIEFTFGKSQEQGFYGEVTGKIEF